MAPIKRKSPHDEPQPQRRATRRHPVEEPEKKQLRSGRVRGVSDAAEKPYLLTATVPKQRDAEEARGRRGSDASGKKARVGRPPERKQGDGGNNIAANANANVAVKRNGTRRSWKENVDPNESQDELQEDVTVEAPVRRLTQDTVNVRASTDSLPAPQTRLVPSKAAQGLRATGTNHLADTTPTTTTTSTPKRVTASPVDKPPKPPPTPRSDRNIDMVVLGDICFKAWYPSYYGKEVTGDVSNNNNTVGAKGGGKIGGRMGGGKRAPPPMLERLYVCPCCFKYSRELVMWWEHVRCCEKSYVLPGRRVYTHPKGAKMGVRVPAVVDGAAGRKGKRKSDVSVELNAEEQPNNEGEWSILEVDGDKDRLFCQNLSLFAKLFLDNKSVFFDVTGFNYFLLVYTPPPSSNTQPPSALATADTNHTAPTSTTTNSTIPQQSSIAACEAGSRVVGFFSKEKLSWDNNNLACILVFPPWQRKGLGSLLMGVSYEISRREGVLGGPEKPISELGRKGYKRFWAGEIARWLLDYDLPTASPDDEKATETLISIEQCSKATWIVPEDCLAVLREMGIVEDAGVGPAEVTPSEAENGTTAADEGEEEEEEVREVKMVPRVRLDKEALRRWVEANKIELTLPCDPEGFVEGYAVRKSEGEEVDEG
ncbi:acyl-CoA N-acyltransferase [Hypoxylon trugodes]|uniref:acyl-CoA N-acyltransferase n=1 Tax=Hypoxylon trugodes TaxID=326681 RepID=UPI00218F47B1|nr:acyl-CoA N-acyltransferase [Hypoxylon trugodes]KAI1385450.1 acyl-CoA N-acyltransferase [Hypoxylon trugodes]